MGATRSLVLLKTCTGERSGLHPPHRSPHIYFLFPLFSSSLTFVPTTPPIASDLPFHPTQKGVSALTHSVPACTTIIYVGLSLLRAVLVF